MQLDTETSILRGYLLSCFCFEEQMIGLALLTLALQTKTPLDFGKEALQEATGNRYGDVVLAVRPNGQKENYAIKSRNGKVEIVGSDPVGAMYGAFEFVERLHNEGAKAWQDNVDGKPFLPDRGLNLFLTLPWNYAKHDTDFDPAALIDPNRWWFQNDDYWKTLLDTMAHSRLNWLDIHGTWDISVTNAPNLYAYFVTSPSFPQVGVSESIKAIDLNRLNKVISMAHERGIRVSLMAYEARLRIPQNPNPPYEETEANIYKYTREVVEQMIRKAPGLDSIGFRIGESGRSESFFKCYEEAVKLSGRDIPLYTRSWVSRRQKILPLARSSKDFSIEIKYNGEQWGTPYPVMGGRMANWGSYSFEDYLSDAGRPGENAKTWRGWPAEGGGRWPDNPYKEIWQVRANGTHRIFPFYNPDWVRRSISAMKVGTASGYTIEGDDAYYPKSQEYYLANPQDKYCDWMHQRDEMYWMTWGRLGYDPSTPDSVFDAKVADWFGSQGPKIAHLWKEASEVVPLSYMTYALGPDHRDHAPELETGGDQQAFVDGQGFDTFAIESAHEALGLPLMGATDYRISPATIGDKLHQIATEIRAGLGSTDQAAIPPSSAGRYGELKNAMYMLSDLASYYAARFVTAARPSGPPALGDIPIIGTPGFEPVPSVRNAWEALSNSSEANFYKPFTERLRMHTNTFHWRDQLPAIAKESIAAENRLPMFGEVGSFSTDATLTWHRSGGHIIARVPFRGVVKAGLLYKPLPSSTFFHRVDMHLSGDAFVAEIPDLRCGSVLAAEIWTNKLHTLRIPSFLDGKKPYIVVPAKAGPTPQIYATDEAMTFLDPKILNPEKLGTILIAPRAATFFRYSKATKRKLLEGVQRGEKLVVLQQDFAAARYSLDFLPKPLTVSANPQPNVFDGGGALGIGRLEADGIQWQRFNPSDGWEILGPSAGLAHMKYGKGEIWVTTGRFMQTMTVKPGANGLGAVLNACRGPKPVVLIDPGTESSVYSTAIYPDLMNALDIQFLTLGEAIAQEQGTDSYKPIEGVVMDDDVLAGKGSQIVNAFLKNRVEKMSALPTPAKADFEAIRKARKAELMKTLGLDPMPAKAPLNVRRTGVIQGNGYHIEKIVYESRPRWYVTAHVYVPEGLGPARHPIIVNVNGHWAHKKDEDRIQLRCQFQALQGYIAIAIDSPGHSFEGDNLIERRPEGDHNDWMLVEGGSNTTGYYVWDAIRGLDYMATRSDTDMEHIGITGASGGGLATLYTFAADDRYKAAVPVVYMASLELAPDNGCLCNHVPGTCQIGDRSDVIAIQAPKPVYIMGAQNDGEFTPAATLLTGKKMAATWGLFGKSSDTFARIYPGGHDYNQSMREQMIGFFNKYLKGQGDGSPVPQPSLTAINPEDHQLLVLDPPAAGERTMRDLSREYLENAPADVPLSEVIRINGGIPAKTDLKYREIGTGLKRDVILEPQPGLQIPGLLFLPHGTAKAVNIVVYDSGKLDAEKSARKPDEAYLYLDCLGMGEVGDFELRYALYMGTSIPFLDGWQIVRAAEAMRRYSPTINIVGRGPIASQAVMYAGLMDHGFASVLGQQCMRSWTDVFADNMSPYAVQPRAHLCGSLEHLRSLVPNSHWEFGN